MILEREWFFIILINIENMTTLHLDGVEEIENLSFKIPWSRNAFMDELTRNESAIYKVAMYGKKVVGYAGMWKVFDEGHITNIAVHPEFRKSGVGSRLLESMLETAREQGIVAMTLEVRKSNVAAQHLYHKYGFRTEGERRRYYADNGEDALIMWKQGIC